MPNRAPLSENNLAKINKNLRSKKGVEAAQESTSMENNLERLTTLVSNLGEKIDKLDTDSRSRHDEICGKLQLLEERTNTLGKEVNDTKEGLNFVDEQVKTVKDSLMKKADQTTWQNWRRRLRTSRTVRRGTIIL